MSGFRSPLPLRHRIASLLRRYSFFLSSSSRSATAVLYNLAPNSSRAQYFFNFYMSAMDAATIIIRLRLNNMAHFIVFIFYSCMKYVIMVAGIYVSLDVMRRIATFSI